MPCGSSPTACRARAGWPLLQTYHDERRDVSQRITSQSLENSINVLRIVAAATGGESGLSAEDIVTASRRYGNHLGVEFGAAYASAAVVADGTSRPPVADSYSDYVQTATPGCRAPHVWLGRPGCAALDARSVRISLYAAGRAGRGRVVRRCGQRRAMRSVCASTAIGSAPPGLNDLGGFTSAYGVHERRRRARTTGRPRRMAQPFRARHRRRSGQCVHADPCPRDLTTAVNPTAPPGCRRPAQRSP